MIACLATAAPVDRVADAIAALQQGDLPAAERLLRVQTSSQPEDAAAFLVLGIVLDQEHKYGEADATYKRALALDAHDPTLLNNYGNHLLAAGRGAQARMLFGQVIAIDPTNANANVQLAKLAVAAGRGSEALTYFAHLTPQDVAAPDVELVLGTALASDKRYREAEQHFEHVAKAQPDRFEAQYDLGLAASKNNRFDVAEQALRRALELKPNDPDVLYDLAVVELKAGKGVEAIALLAQGGRSFPERADIQLLLAQSTSRLGYFDDSIAAWDRYLQLRPTDEAGQRERAFARSAVGKDSQQALADLTAYAAKHPSDPVGHYELGTALSANDPVRAGRELTRAIQLDPALTSAHVALGLIAYRQGSTEAAVREFRLAARQQPNNSRILDRLGESYLATGQLEQALPVLKKASDLAPDDPSVLLHLGRALTRSGQPEMASDVFKRYRTVQGSNLDSPHESGFVEFLSLPPGEQQARYRAGIERTVAAQPGNVEAQTRYLEVLLSDGETTRAGEAWKTILQLQPSQEQLAAAGRALLDAGEYSVAEALLDEAIKEAGSAPSLQLELARARLYTAGPQAALAAMSGIDESARPPGYDRARAEVLAMMAVAQNKSQQ
jgi:Flp pilus assembly protein TadD